MRDKAIEMLVNAANGAGHNTLAETIRLETTPIARIILDVVEQALATPVPMTEQEMLQRAREAATAASALGINYSEEIKDDYHGVKSALAALRALQPVDPIVETCNALVKANPGSDSLDIAIIAYKAGQDAR